MWVTEFCLQLFAQKDKPILASHIHQEPLPMADAAPVQPEPKAAAKRSKARKKVVLRDVAQLKRHKEHLQQQLKKSIADLRTQLQKRRRILKRAGNLEPEDLAWLQEQLRLKREAQEAEATTG